MTKIEARGRTRRVVAIFVAVQIAIPGAMLTARWINEGSTPVSELPLSWQMYSAVHSGIYVGVDSAGDEVTLSIDGLPFVIRDVGYGDSVQRMLCDLSPDLVTVRRVDPDALLQDQTEDVTC